MKFNKTNNSSYFHVNSFVLPYNHYTQLDWLIPISLNIFFMTSTGWILVSLIHFGIKTGKWKQIQRNKEDKLNAGLVYSSVVGCAIICLVYYIFSNIYLNSGFDKSQNWLCDVTYDASVFLYLSVILSVFLFLWSRQHAFYANRMYNVNFSKTVRVFSFISIFIILIGEIPTMTLYVVTQQSVATSRGCKVLSSNGSGTVLLLLVTVVRISLELVLSGLFLNALRQTKRKHKNQSLCCFIVRKFCCLKCVTNVVVSTRNVLQFESKPVAGNSSNTLTNKTVSSTTNDVISIPPRRQSKRKSFKNVVRRILRKTIVFQILSFSADILLFNSKALFFSGTVKYHRRYLITIADTNVLLNLLLVLFSFVGWKRMMMSPCPPHD